MLTDVHPCPDCGDERPFEQPPCADGHGPDCAEWVCVDCGTALWIGGPVLVLEAGRLLSPAA